MLIISTSDFESSHEDPAPAMAKQGLSGGALDDPDAEESERSDAIARGRVGRFF